MNAEERKQLVRQLIEEAITSGHLEPLQAHPGLHEIIPTLQRVLPTLSNRSVSFPLQFTEGEWVATRTIHSGVHTETGARIEYEVLMLNRVVDGVIIQQHSVADLMQILRAMGVQMPDLPG
ncbi:MAG: ester cyclase [Anaerolineae bacterium]|nr:ester cyclase [Anaerolineae bacterium]